MDRQIVKESVAFEDAQLLAENTDMRWERLDGSTVLVTGATGLIGSQLVNALLCRGTVRVLAMIRSIEKTDVLISSAESRHLRIICSDICKSCRVDENIDYMVHCAAPTSSKDFKDKPLQVINTIVDGTENLLRLACEKMVKRFIFLSSAEVYGIRHECEYVDEYDYGRVDPMQVRSSYPESKRLAECICRAFSTEYGLDTVVARMGVVLGPGMRKNDERVLAQFAKSVLESKPIELHTEGKTVRSYCYTRDAVKALLALLCCPGDTQSVYNIANKNMIMSIREIADTISRNYPDVSIEYSSGLSGAASRGYMDTTFVPLRTQRLEALGWKPEVGFEEAFARLLKWYDQPL